MRAAATGLRRIVKLVVVLMLTAVSMVALDASPASALQVDPCGPTEGDPDPCAPETATPAHQETVTSLPSTGFGEGDGSGRPPASMVPLLAALLMIALAVVVTLTRRLTR